MPDTRPLSATAVLFRSVDRAAFIAALGDQLRRTGVAVPQSGLVAFAHALRACPPHTLPTLYWTARVTLVSRHHELPVFDEVFAAVFEKAGMGIDPHARRRSEPLGGQEGDALVRVPAEPAAETEDTGLPWHTLPSAAARDDGAPSSVHLHDRLPSDLTSVADVPFADLDPADLIRLCSWLEQSLRRWPVRRSRRRSTHKRGGTIDLRRTLSRSRRTGGEAAELVRTRPVERPRPVVMLCDVSQSMQPYATAYLHLMRTLARTGEAETFAFSTTVTRLTAVLRHRSAHAAIDQATMRVVDRYGGTRIATNVRTLLSSRHGNSVRGGIVIVASDGWDSDPPEDLARAMARLHRRAYRVVWLNPRAGSPGFAPLVASMTAALPYCDEFLPAHTVDALGDALTVIGRAR